ncbi:MAG: SDR family oxidoreductase [Silicimonas sp.]|jgi:NAD(P)-dependent dehydrogenase (short-subunit alcohol dehydrogenase family)|uniref:SDR family NAD(P)-dependent oxidoreductase n=1 Tax=Roseitalea porphyridii TaxID=1852022 RepID=UPI0032F08408
MTASAPFSCLSSKVFVVAGGTSGIGRAVCETLVGAGAEVMSLDIKEPAVPSGKHIACDITSREDLTAAAAAVAKPINGVVNAAGVSSADDPTKIMCVNLIGAMNVCSVFAPYLEERAAIINVASSAGNAWKGRESIISEFFEQLEFENLPILVDKFEMDGRRAYIFSKEALIYFTKRLAFTQATNSIRALSISPGLTDTPMLPDLKRSLNPKIIERLSSFSDGQVADPREIADVVAFALTQHASWLNGVDLIVDGGAHLVLEFSDDDVG